MERRMNNVFLLLIVFQIKHFLSDFPLQTPYMMGKFKKQGWVIPLLTHCLMHSTFTLAILSVLGKPNLLWLPAVDLVCHFIIDRVKATLPYRDPSKSSFWCSLGIDQMMHHLTHYFIIWMIVRN
jgi:hypothetical protein